MIEQLPPDEARVAFLQALGASREEAELIEQHVMAEAHRAFDYGLKVVRTLTPERVHELAGAAYSGAMRGLCDDYRSALAAQAGQTRQ